MVIVSQDRRTIVNFENIKTIELDRETNFTSINIFRETNQVETGVCGLYIGSYKTEERAKEVLKEIIQKIEDTSMVNLMENLEISIHDPNFGGSLSSVYYMPEDKED